MRLLSPWFVQQFPAKILNIHPSLLPSFPGLEAQQQAFAYGVKITGCTVHFVDEELDHGAIIVQKAVSVLDSDDEHTLAARILEQEHIAYSEAIRIVLEGKFEIVGRRLVKGQIVEKLKRTRSNLCRVRSNSKRFYFFNLTSHLCNPYIMSSFLLRAIGCCITSSSFFTRFSP